MFGKTVAWSTLGHAYVKQTRLGALNTIDERHLSFHRFGWVQGQQCEIRFFLHIKVLNLLNLMGLP